MRRFFLFAAAMLLVLGSVRAQEGAAVSDLKSPDGRLIVSFNLTGTENPTYSVTYDGKKMLEDSPIGIMLDMGSKPTLEGTSPTS